jgi:hypothetical protein
MYFGGTQIPPALCRVADENRPKAAKVGDRSIKSCKSSKNPKYNTTSREI